MIRQTSFKLVIVFFLTVSLLFNSLLSIPAFAESSDLFNKENLLSLVKGVATLYLLNRVNSYITGQDGDYQSTVVDQNPAASKHDFSQIDGKIIVIDAGHGGSDPGAVGAGGLREKDVTLDIALRVYQLLKANTNAQVYLTRDSDRYVSLSERSSMANGLGADAFISIHINGAENGIERGIETYAHYNSPEDAWALAWYLQDSLVKRLGLLDRGLKAENFHVVRETNMEAVLLEVGFITDRTEENLLRQASTREKAARAIYEGIFTYYRES